MPTHETRIPSVEELAVDGAKFGWELVESEPRRLDDGSKTAVTRWSPSRPGVERPG